MAFVMRANDLGHGILVSGIESQLDALFLRQFFGDNGLACSVDSHAPDGYEIFLPSVSPATYDWLRTGLPREYALPEVEKRIADTRERVKRTFEIIEASRELNKKLQQGLDDYWQNR